MLARGRLILHERDSGYVRGDIHLALAHRKLCPCGHVLEGMVALAARCCCAVQRDVVRKLPEFVTRGKLPPLFAMTMLLFVCR